VIGGSSVSVSVSGVSAPVGLSYSFVPSILGSELEVEIEVLLDGVYKIGGTDAVARGEIWKNGVRWKTFGMLAGFSDTQQSGTQLKGNFIDSFIPTTNTPIVYSVQGGIVKLGGVTSSSILYNWGVSTTGATFSGNTTASYMKIIERLK
jgi:hypothetical protein